MSARWPMQLQIPFFGAASRSSRKPSFTIFHAFGASIWPMKRSCKHLVIIWIFSRSSCLIISLTTGQILALACSTKSTVISALRASVVNCWFPFFLKYSNDVFLYFFRLLLISVHFFTKLLQFLLPFFCPHTIQSAVFFVFFTSSRAFHEVFGPDFPGQFLQYLPLDLFRATRSSLLTIKPSPAYSLKNSLLSCNAPLFSAAVSTVFCIVAKSSSTLSSPFSVTFSWIRFSALRKVGCLFFVIYPGIYGIMAATLPTSWLHRKRSLHHPFSCDVSSPNILLMCRRVKAVSFALPHLNQVDVSLQLNSFMIPFHISFLTPGSLSYPLPTEGPRHVIQLLDVLFVCTHHSQYHVEITCNVVICGSTPSFSQYFQHAWDQKSSYISIFLLQSGAYTAITRVVPKRIAAHLSLPTSMIS